MDVLTAGEIDGLIRNSSIARKYSTPVDRDTAKEILERKIAAAQSEDAQAELREQQAKAKASVSPKRRLAVERSTIEKMADSTVGRQIGRTVARELTRGLLGVLGIKSSSRRTSSWF